MKSTILAISLLLALTGGIGVPTLSAQSNVTGGARISTQSAQPQWKINPAASAIQFRLKNMGMPVNGKFTELAGEVTYDGRNLSAATVQATIDTGSIETGIGRRDHHLRGKDFFNVSVFPAAEFHSSKIEVKPSGDFQIIGTLTLHGVPLEVTLDVLPLKTKVDKDGHNHLLASASTTLLRRTFGIGGFTAAAIGNDVTISVLIDLVEI